MSGLIALVFALTLGVSVGMAADSRDYGAVRVDRDTMYHFQGGCNEFGMDAATNSGNAERDTDLEKRHPDPASATNGICGETQKGVRCRRGSM